MRGIVERMHSSSRSSLRFVSRLLHCVEENEIAVERRPERVARIEKSPQTIRPDIFFFCKFIQTLALSLAFFQWL